MNFADLRFWGYLFCAMVVVLVLRAAMARMPGGRSSLSSGRWDRSALALVGLFLLGCVNLLTLAIFLSVVLLTYVGLSFFLRARHPVHRWVLISVLVPLQLLPLLYFKYAGFIANGVMRLGIDSFADLLIPVGLSFYTFQLVGFVVDTVLHREPLPKFVDFLNFAGFFPQIVAGPIERRESLLPQVEAFRFRWNLEDIDEGVRWVVVGLFFKICLADNLATYFDPSSVDNPFLIWLANLIFGLRIYYDFAGYSLTALGIARCFGLRLTLNFASPYCSRSIQDFWRRWHITLSTWFRDYMYIPLGGNRARNWPLVILIVFVVSGIWHGAGWNFVAWGAIHGILLIGCRLYAGMNRPLPGPVAWGLTMFGAFFAWLAFYETRTNVLITKMGTLCNPFNYSPNGLRSALASLDPTQTFVLAGFLVLVAASIAMEWLSLRRFRQPYVLHRNDFVIFALVILTILLAPSEKNDFIYFAF